MKLRLIIDKIFVIVRYLMVVKVGVCKFKLCIILVIVVRFLMNLNEVIMK